jgi:hypothetical protein
MTAAEFAAGWAESATKTSLERTAWAAAWAADEVREAIFDSAMEADWTNTETMELVAAKRQELNAMLEGELS